MNDNMTAQEFFETLHRCANTYKSILVGQLNDLKNSDAGFQKISKLNGDVIECDVIIQALNSVLQARERNNAKTLEGQMSLLEEDK